jgi:endonuclease YncB( thermonuclease family)
MNRGRWIGCGAVALTVVLATAGFLVVRRRDSSDDLPPDVGRVERTVDGDTLVVDLGGDRETIRLVGVDTPETVDPDQSVECFGPEASHHLAELLPPDTLVRLERDVEPRDRYGRLLAYLYRTSDDLFVNHDLVAGGYAEARSYPPNTALDPELQAAQRQAQTGHAGQWGACPAQ